MNQSSDSVATVIQDVADALTRLSEVKGTGGRVTAAVDSTGEMVQVAFWQDGRIVGYAELGDDGRWAGVSCT